MSELRQILDRLAELADQNALMIANQDVMHGELRNALARIAHIEERVAKLETDPPTTFRAPQPSLTSEERHHTLDSIRAAVEHQTEKQTPYIEATARASKLTPYAITAGIIVSAFISGLMQNCHIVGGHSWETHSVNYSVASASLSPR
jgi:hypothetical protein